MRMIVTGDIVSLFVCDAAKPLSKVAMSGCY